MIPESQGGLPQVTPSTHGKGRPMSSVRSSPAHGRTRWWSTPPGHPMRGCRCPACPWPPPGAHGACDLVVADLTRQALYKALPAGAPQIGHVPMLGSDAPGTSDAALGLPASLWAGTGPGPEAGFDLIHAHIKPSQDSIPDRLPKNPTANFTHVLSPNSGLSNSHRRAQLRRLWPSAAQTSPHEIKRSAS